MFEINKLKTGYSSSNAISDFGSVFVKRGEPLGVAGINGAGKTTFLKTIAGVIPPVEGDIVFYSNKAPLFFDSHYDMEKFRSLVGYCPDVGGLIPSATPNEHVAILLSLIPKELRQEVAAQAETIFERVGLEEVADEPAGTFSHGMMRRASVALAYLNAREVLILDEPFDGVDPDGVRKIQSLIEEAESENKVIIISSHLINVLADSVDNIMVMTGGNVLDLQPASAFKSTAGLKKYNNFIQEVSVR